MKSSKDHAKKLRSNMTEVEKILWYQLRAKRLNGNKFRRQANVGNYIVDFVCFDKKVIVELDGGQHNFQDNITYDSNRSRWLKSEGFKILRFWNNDITNNLDAVLDCIINAIQSPSS
jgi:very-short-patch-repair endonuclease